MKISVLALCLVYLMLLMGCAVSCKQKPTLPTPPPVVSANPFQHKAAHSLTFLNEKDAPIAGCSATAIGLHALLTALHCDEHGQWTSLNIDLSTHTYHILSGVVDDRDHLILIVDGPEFKNTVSVIQRSAVLGEHIYMYGFGGGDYPAHRYDGTVIEEREGGDPSDVDAFAGIENYSFPVILGDSGSAVFGNDGAIVGVITYRRTGNPSYSTGFALNFPQDVLDKVETLK